MGIVEEVRTYRSAPAMGGDEHMPITYDKLFRMMESKGITFYKLRKDAVIGNATYEKMRKGEGHIDTRSIESLCHYLDCQPSDIMEYVEDGEE